MRTQLFLKIKLIIIFAILSLAASLALPVLAQADEVNHCLAIDPSSNADAEHCRIGLAPGVNCVDDPKCYWLQCEAAKGGDQAECDKRYAEGGCQGDRATGRKDCKCNFVKVGKGNTKTPISCIPEPEPKTSPPPLPSGEETKPCGPGGKYQCIELNDPLGGKASEVPEMLGLVIKAALGLVGSLTLLMLVWGGFTWLTSAGNAERVKKGTDTMLWAIIGVLLVFASYLIVSTFTNYLTGAQ